MIVDPGRHWTAGDLVQAVGIPEIGLVKTDYERLELVQSGQFFVQVFYPGTVRVSAVMRL